MLKTKKQKIILLSNAEAEFRGIAKRVTKIIRLMKLMNELCFPQNEHVNFIVITRQQSTFLKIHSNMTVQKS